MTAMDFVPVFAAALLVVATVGYRRLQLGAQPLRMSMAEKGEKLLADARVPQDLKDHLEFLLERAFTMRTELLISMLLVPFVTLSILIKPKILEDVDQEMRSLPPEVRIQTLEVMRLHDRITAANNPILQFLLELEMTLIVYPVVMVTNIIRGMNLGVDPRTVKCVVERESDDFLHRHAHAVRNAA